MTVIGVDDADLDPGVYQVYVYRCFGCPAVHVDPPIKQIPERRPSNWRSPTNWCEIWSEDGVREMYCEKCFAKPKRKA